MAGAVSQVMGQEHQSMWTLVSALFNAELGADDVLESNRDYFAEDPLAGLHFFENPAELDTYMQLLEHGE